MTQIRREAFSMMRNRIIEIWSKEPNLTVSQMHERFPRMSKERIRQIAREIGLKPNRTGILSSNEMECFKSDPKESRCQQKEIMHRTFLMRSEISRRRKEGVDLDTAIKEGE